MRGLILLFSVLALTGCVSEKTAMVNQEGKVVHCDAWGFGWLGAPVAMAQHHDCVKNAQAAGYAVAGAPVPPSAPASASPSVVGDPSDAASQAFDRLHPSAPQDPQAQDAATKATPAANQAVNSAAPASPARRLEELDKLYKAGLITKDEYDRKRQQILSTL